MKRYQFNLETVLRARRAQESVARADLQRSNLLAASAEAASKKSREHYEEVVGSVGPLYGAPGTIRTCGQSVAWF